MEQNTGLKIFLIAAALATVSIGGYLLYKNISETGSTAAAKKNRKLIFHR